MSSAATPSQTQRLVDRIPPHAYFMVSAVFHYLGPSFAVLLFAQLAPSGVAWLRIGSAGLVFAIWRRPWGVFAALPRRDQVVVAALGVVLAAMNTLFYEAIARLPLATVGAIEFLGPIAVAAWGMRTRRNLFALALAAAGVFVLTDVRIAGEPLGYVFAFANCGLFMGTSCWATASRAGSPACPASTGSRARCWSRPSPRCRSACAPPCLPSRMRRCSRRPSASACRRP